MGDCKMWGAALAAVATLTACGQGKESPASAQIVPMSKDASGQAGWRPFELAGSFAANVPAAPSCKEQDAGGGVKATACSMETERSGMMLMDTKLPAGTVGEASSAKALSGAMEGAAKSMGGKIVSSSDVDMPGARGKSFRISTPDGPVIYKILLADDSLVQAMAMPKRGAKPDEEEMARFVGSLTFKMGPPSAPKTASEASHP